MAVRPYHNYRCVGKHVIYTYFVATEFTFSGLQECWWGRKLIGKTPLDEW